jgi:hypothetical protein
MLASVDASTRQIDRPFAVNRANEFGLQADCALRIGGWATAIWRGPIRAMNDVRGDDRTNNAQSGRYPQSV